MSPETQMRNLTIVAGSAVAALIATVLPYTSALWVSETALQVHPILIVPPGIVLVAFWLLRQAPPTSFTPNRIYSLRICFGASIALWLIDASTIGNSQHLLKAEVGFIAYIAAVGVGMFFSLKCGTADRFTSWPSTPVSSWPSMPASSAPAGSASSRPPSFAPSGPQVGPEPDTALRRPATQSAAQPQESHTTPCPSCGKVNLAIRSNCQWCGAALTKPTAMVAVPEPPEAGFIWSPTHVVPDGGMPFWDAPDTARPSVGQLPEKAELTLEGRVGVWAQVRAANGRRAWVDGRLLVDRT